MVKQAKKEAAQFKCNRCERTKPDATARDWPVPFGPEQGSAKVCMECAKKLMKLLSDNLFSAKP